MREAPQQGQGKEHSQAENQVGHQERPPQQDQEARGISTGLAEEEPLPLEHVQSIDFHKRKHFAKKRAKDREERTKKQRDGIFADVKTTGEGNVAIRKAYDDIVSSMKELIGDFSYEARREKNDIRGNKERFCDRCGRQVCRCGQATSMGAAGGATATKPSGDASGDEWLDSDDDGW